MATTHRILFTREGNENSTTAMYVKAVYTEGMVDLEATGSFCWSFDDNRLVTDKLYEVRNVTLPDWLPAEEWVRNNIEWKYTFALGVDERTNPAFARFLAYSNLGAASKLALVKLWNTKSFRSEFRKSLRAQLEAFINTPADERKYPQPFSSKQWQSLVTVHDQIEARRIGERTYRS